MLNNREIAIIIWVTILGIFLISNRDFSESLKNLLSMLIDVLKFKIMIFSYIYILVVYFVLYQFGLINVIWFDYVKWVMLAFFPLIYKVSTNYLNISLFNLVKGLFKWSIFPLFIISEYTFSLWIELLLAPFLSMLIMLISVVNIKYDGDPQYTLVKKALNYLLLILGIMILIVSFSSFFMNILDVEKISFWKKMLVDLLVIFHLPLLFIFKFYMYYEDIFALLITRTEPFNNFKGRLHTRYLIFSMCYFNADKLMYIRDQVRRSYGIKNMADFKTKINLNHYKQ